MSEPFHSRYFNFCKNILLELLGHNNAAYVQHDKEVLFRAETKASSKNEDYIVLFPTKTFVHVALS